MPRWAPEACSLRALSPPHSSLSSPPVSPRPAGNSIRAGAAGASADRDGKRLDQASLDAMTERLSRPALAKQLAMQRQREEAAWMEAAAHEQAVQAAPTMNARSRMLAEAAGGGAALHVRAAEWAAERARRLAEKRAALEWAEQQALAPAGSVNRKARRRAAERRREKRKTAEGARECEAGSNR